MSKEELDKLAKKHKVKAWYWLNTLVYTDENGKNHSVQMVSNIEELFKKGSGKVVNVYASRLDNNVKSAIGGIITDN
tara:strand:- start:258 stop:488 length:231 start_codon:yes stop_codon:yes gene_type:complete